MSVYLPDNRITAPELWHPGRKPTVPVKVNWNHPLTKGLVSALIPSDSGNFIFDYVANRKIEVDLVRNGVVIFDGTKGYAVGASAMGGQSGCTVTARAYTNSTNSNNNIVSSHSDLYVGQDEFLSLRFDVVGVWSGNSNVFKAAFVNQGDGGIESKVNSYQVGKFCTVSSSWKRGDSFGEAYVNGLNSTSDGRNAIVQTQTALSSGQVYLGQGPQQPLDGGISFVFLHNRKLSDSEIASLHLNPYQFLEAA